MIFKPARFGRLFLLSILAGIIIFPVFFVYPANDAFAANSSPEIVSVSPSSGSVQPGTSRTFTTVYKDPDGYQNLKDVRLLINTSPNGSNCCYLRYDQNTNRLYLRNNSNSTWLGGIIPESFPFLMDTIIENSYCKLDCSKTTVSASGTTLTVKWNITFKSAFASTTPKNIYLYAKDDSNLNTGWVQKGTYLVGSNQPPSIGTLSPNSGLTRPDIALNFTTTYTDPNSYKDIQYVRTLINTSASGSNCCYVHYNQNTNKLYLRNDSNSSWLGGYCPGSSNVLQNSYSKLDCSQTTVSASGTTLTVKWHITFKQPFEGTTPKKIYLYVRDDSNASTSWVQKGTYSIDGTPPSGSIKINNDSQYTNSTSVTLTLSASDSSGIDKMRFSTDNSNWSTPEDFSTTKTYTLSSSNGQKTVYVRYSDNAGNWSGSYQDNIILDTVKPVTSDSGIDNLWHNSSVTVTLNASDSGSGGIDKTYYSTNGSNPTIIYASPFAVSAEGIHTIKYYSTDNAGNSEEIKTASEQVKIDNTLPTGSIEINDGSEYTSSTTVTLTLSAQDSTSGIDKMKFSTDNSNWSTPEDFSTAKTYTLSSSNGQKTVYVRYSDNAGNWSGSYQDSIILDTIAPVLSIDPLTTPTNQDVTLSYSVSDNLIPSGEITVTGDDSPYINEGDYNITLTAKDKADNTTQASVSFTIDKTPPAVVITYPEDNFTTDQAQLTVLYTADGIEKSEDFTLIEGSNTLTITETDPAGNSSSVSITVTLGIFVPADEGGTVASDDEEVKVIIPPEALPEDTCIDVSCPDPAQYQDAVPEDYTLDAVAECKPDNLTFNEPVKLVFTLDAPQIPGTPVYLGLYNETNGQIEIEEFSSFVSKDGITAEFTITHFSTYAALSSMLSQGAAIGASTKTPLPDLFTGSFSHSIPISVPKGRKGIQPNLQLQYRSSNANSQTGAGWTLNTGYITRRPKKGLPQYDDTKDVFTFVSDSFSTELVRLTDNLYQAKIEGAFIKFFKEPTDSWKTVSKDGSMSFFGTTPDSRETGTGNNTFNWYLTKSIDNNSNYITYIYTKDQGKTYLSRIEYTGNENLSVPPKYSVDFYLEDRQDVMSNYLSGEKITTAKRLKTIEVSFNVQLVWRYELTYEESPDTGRSLLKTLAQSAADGTAYPAQTFEYQQKQ